MSDRKSAAGFAAAEMPWPGRSKAVQRNRGARAGMGPSRMSSAVISVPWISTTSGPAPSWT